LPPQIFGGAEYVSTCPFGYRLPAMPSIKITKIAATEASTATRITVSRVITLTRSISDKAILKVRQDGLRYSGQYKVEVVSTRRVCGKLSFSFDNIKVTGFCLMHMNI
jgi:hypothetical protein